MKEFVSIPHGRVFYSTLISNVSQFFLGEMALGEEGKKNMYMDKKLKGEKKKKGNNVITQRVNDDADDVKEEEGFFLLLLLCFFFFCKSSFFVFLGSFVIRLHFFFSFCSPCPNNIRFFFLLTLTHFFVLRTQDDDEKDYTQCTVYA